MEDKFQSGLSLDKKIQIERIISENGECVNIVVVLEAQMKYRKMDWSGGIQMVDKMMKEQDKKGGGPYGKLESASTREV